MKDHKTKHGVNRTTKQSANGTAKHGVNGTTEHSVNGTTKYSVSAATVTRSYNVNGTTQHSVNGESVTRSHGVNKPTRQNANDVHTRGAGVNSSSTGGTSLDHGVNGSAFRQTEKSSRVNWTPVQDDASDFSKPLRIQVPESSKYVGKFGGDTTKKHGKSRTVHTLNQRNRDGHGVGFGDVNATPELIISDDDGSSITTVSSAYTGIYF